MNLIQTLALAAGILACILWIVWGWPRLRGWLRRREIRRRMQQRRNLAAAIVAERGFQDDTTEAQVLALPTLLRAVELDDEDDEPGEYTPRHAAEDDEPARIGGREWRKPPVVALHPTKPPLPGWGHDTAEFAALVKTTWGRDLDEVGPRERGRVQYEDVYEVAR